jgi:hypothetical protein
MGGKGVPYGRAETRGRDRADPARRGSRWDVAGALQAGCAAAFVARPGMVLNPLFEPPDVVGADLREVANAIIEVGA